MQIDPMDPGVVEEQSSDAASVVHAQLAELEGKYKRALADLANREREFTRERSEFVKFAAADVVRDFLPIVDAIDAAAQDANAQGIAAIGRLFDDFFARHGIARIPTTGTIDYFFHEVVGQRSGDATSGTILEEVQAGYTMHGKCLRPAKVIVAEGVASGK